MILIFFPPAHNAARTEYLDYIVHYIACGIWNEWTDLCELLQIIIRKCDYFLLFISYFQNSNTDNKFLDESYYIIIYCTII